MRLWQCNIIFSLSMCILNARALKREAAYHQEVEKTFLIPAVAAVVMGVVALVIYFLCNLVMSQNIAVIIALLVAVVVYGVSLLKFGGLSQEEILALPKWKHTAFLVSKITFGKRGVCIK